MIVYFVLLDVLNEFVYVNNPIKLESNVIEAVLLAVVIQTTSAIRDFDYYRYLQDKYEDPSHPSLTIFEALGKWKFCSKGLFY
jgi:hypothetical protein